MMYVSRNAMASFFERFFLGMVLAKLNALCLAEE
jgi:hypothetical protein